MNTALGCPEILGFEARHKDGLVQGGAGVASPVPLMPAGTGGAGTAATATGYVIQAPALTELQKLAVVGGPESLAFWATHYLTATALGGSPHTLDAKSRDLRAFVAWFGRAVGTVNARAWRGLDTKSYLGHLEARRLAPTTINRALATLRHFARWLQDRHGLFGAMGIPTHEVKDVTTDESTCKKLSDEEVRALFKAAADRVVLLDAKRARAAEVGGKDPTRRARPRRDFAMLALLYYCGLRATEQVMLQRRQFTGSHLVNVARKGRNVTRRLYLPMDGRRVLDDYLAHERQRDDRDGNAEPLFVSTGERAFLLRTDLSDALERIADEANKHRPECII
jgi:site-specific recombinase XerD